MLSDRQINGSQNTTGEGNLTDGDVNGPIMVQVMLPSMWF